MCVCGVRQCKCFAIANRVLKRLMCVVHWYACAYVRTLNWFNDSDVATMRVCIFIRIRAVYVDEPGRTQRDKGERMCWRAHAL